MKKICVVLGIAGIIFSCSSPEFVENSELINDVISVKDNMLCFPNAKELEKVLSGKKELPVNITFVSQRDIFNEVVQKEYDYACSLKNLSDEEYEKVSKHSDMYLKLVESNFLKEENYQDGTKMYDLNLLIPTYSKILNKEGFFAINDTIFQMTKNLYRAWPKCTSLKDTNKVQNIILGQKPNISTKSLFPLHSVNQAVAYVFTSHTSDRAILTFYDHTTLAIPNVNREIYIRTSFQRKLDGRNYSYMSWPYTLRVNFTLNVEGVEREVYLDANGTGSNNWYTPYLEYEFLSEGKLIQTYTDTYYYITFFRLESGYEVDREHTSDMLPYETVGVHFDGKRESAFSGPFHYSSIDPQCVRMSELLPE